MPEDNNRNSEIFEKYSNKIIRPSKKEIIKNNPSRSAKLRFAVRSENDFTFTFNLFKKFNKYLDIESLNV